MLYNATLSSKTFIMSDIISLSENAKSYHCYFTFLSGIRFENDFNFYIVE